MEKIISTTRLGQGEADGRILMTQIKTTQIIHKVRQIARILFDATYARKYTIYKDTRLQKVENRRINFILRV